LYVIDEP